MAALELIAYIDPVIEYEVCRCVWAHNTLQWVVQWILQTESSPLAFLYSVILFRGQYKLQVYLPSN